MTHHEVRDSNRLLFLFAAVALLLHLVVNALGGYGYFRDELYYIACTQHLDIGYVDQPPLSIWLLAVNRLLFGDSIFALRLLPAVTGAVIVYLTGLLVRELGGRRFAQVLACTAMTVAPIVLGMTSIYNMNPYDMLLWGLTFYFLLRLLKTENPVYWLALGLTMGLGLLNKISMLWLGFGIAVAFLLTPHRRWYRTRWPWLTAAISFAFFLPFIIWNVTHEFAHVEFAAHAAGFKYASQNPVTFLTGLVLVCNPLALPVWLAGFWYLFRHDDRRLRVPGIAVASVMAILLINIHSKAEYFTPALSMLFAAGAVQCERWFAHRTWLRVGYATVLAAFGILLMPLTLDVLPVETFFRYQTAIGVAPPSTEGHHLTGLPQHYADRFGWKELADSVAHVYQQLTPEERQSCAIHCSNYGEAAAIDFFGRAYGLPRAYSQHNSYYFWGLKQWHHERVFIMVRRDEEDLRQGFESVELRGTVFASHAMPYENDRKIFVCKNLTIPFEQAWKRGKNFD